VRVGQPSTHRALRKVFMFGPSVEHNVSVSAPTDPLGKLTVTSARFSAVRLVAVPGRGQGALGKHRRVARAVQDIAEARLGVVVERRRPWWTAVCTVQGGMPLPQHAV
jgi:hypothetical protein